MTFPPNSCKTRSHWNPHFHFPSSWNIWSLGYMIRLQAFSQHLPSASRSSLSPTRTLGGRGEAGTGPSPSPPMAVAPYPACTVEEGSKLASFILSVLTEQMKICPLTLFLFFPLFYKGTFSSICPCSLLRSFLPSKYKVLDFPYQMRWGG